MAVVDAEGRVRGVDGLRVVDASIFPVVPCANTNFPVLMAAEKIADAMLAGADPAAAVDSPAMGGPAPRSCGGHPHRRSLRRMLLSVHEGAGRRWSAPRRSRRGHFVVGSAGVSGRPARVRGRERAMRRTARRVAFACIGVMAAEPHVRARPRASGVWMRVTG